MSPPTLRRGDLVTVGYGGATVPGVVTLASPNGRSVMLSFEGLLGGHVGAMPALQDDDGVYRSIVTRGEVTLTRWTGQ
jgi:hypothetical protein